MKEPKLRFLADDGNSFPDLKGKRLNDVCEYNKGQSVGVNYVGTENMKQDFSGVNDLDSRNEVKGVAYNIGDTLMSNIRPYLKKTWKADVNGVCSTDVLVFHPTDINSDYLYHNISSEKFISYVMTGAKGTKMPRGDKEHIMNYDIQVPCLSEQQKIASLFSELDSLIQSAEKELEGYKELKQGMLQKMFPKKGETVPEIRFSEFTDDWELCMLGEITKTNPFKPFIAEGASDGSYEVIQQGDTPISGYADGQPFQNYENITIFGDHTLSLYKPKSPFFVASDGVKILSPSIDMDGLFYYYLLTKYKPNSEGYKRHYTIMKGCEASYPTNRDEQMRIAEYFQNLDSLIASQQQELDGYKELKKGLLQQMFC